MNRGRVVAAAVALSLLAGCGPPVEASPPAPDASAFPNQQALDEIATAVERLGRGRLAAVYAGVAIDVSADRVDVWATDPAAVRAATATAPWAGRLRVHRAANAAADLEPTFQRIRRDLEHWRRVGLPVGVAGVRPDGRCVEVGTPDPARARREFPARYPGVALCLVHQPDAGRPHPWDERD